MQLKEQAVETVRETHYQQELDNNPDIDIP